MFKAVFVPNHRVLDTKLIGGGPSPGSAVNPHSLYKVPPWSVGTKVFSGPALGIARGALELIVEEMRSRKSFAGGALMAELPSVQMRVAEAAAEIQAATALLLKDCDDAMTFGATGRSRAIAPRRAVAAQQCLCRATLPAGGRAAASVHRCARHQHTGLAFPARLARHPRRGLAHHHGLGHPGGERRPHRIRGLPSLDPRL